MDTKPPATLAQAIQQLPPSASSNVTGSSASNAKRAGINPDSCSVCGGFKLLRLELPVGHPEFGQLIACPECEVPERAKQMQKLINDSGLLPGETGLTLDDLCDRGEGSKAMRVEVQRMLDYPFGMLTLWGGSGNGKTLALQIVVNAFLQRGQSAIYARLSDLLNYLRDGFDEREPLKTNARYRQVNQVKLLALDEFDKARETPFGREVVDTLMDDRYRYGRERGLLLRHTLLAMNDDPMALPAHIISRLRHDLYGPDGFRIIENRDPDARESGL